MEQTANTPASTLVDFAGRPLLPRDLNRLKKAPFQTRFEPEHAATVDSLRGFVEPKYAYVLFERWRIELVQDGDPVKNYGLFVFSVEERPEQVPKIEFFLRKGYRILHWGNFHKLTSANDESIKKAKMHTDAWVRLESDLERLANFVNVRAENNQLKAELAEKDAALATLEAKQREYERKFAAIEKAEKKLKDGEGK